MAQIGPLNDISWQRWLAERPAGVRAVATQFPPNRLYRLKSTQQRVVIISYGEAEDGSVSMKVAVSARYNALEFERQVFGIEPSDLEECDLPGPDEVTGTVLTQAELAAAIAAGSTKEERMAAVRAAVAAKVAPR